MLLFFAASECNELLGPIFLQQVRKYNVSNNVRNEYYVMEDHLNRNHSGENNSCVSGES